MPIKPTYPGVYVEEVPSGVRTITGVATAITALLGRASRGPLDAPVRIQSFADFERRFGGLWRESPMSYSVQHFFQNGGTDAVIVRVYSNPSVAQTGAGAAADGVATRELAGALGSAVGSLTIAVQPVAGDTMTIGGRVYVFQSLLTNVDGHIQLGEDLERTRANIIGAINQTGTAGTDYAAATVIHPSVQAAPAFSGSRLRLTAKTPGTAGNSIATTETFTSDENGFDAGSLGGVRPGISPDPGVAAQGTLTIGSNPTAGDAVTIGSRTYTFRDAGTWGTDAGTAGNVLIGGGVGDTRANLIAAINGAAGAGTTYGGAADPHPQATAAAAGPPASAIVITALEAGTAGNAITTAATFTAGANRFDAATLGTTRAGVNAPNFTIAAADPGAWGNNLVVKIDHLVADPSDPAAFNIEIEEVDPSLPTGAPPLRSEKFFNVSTEPDSALYVTRVLESRAAMVRIRAPGRNLPEATDGVALTGGSDGQPVTDAEISSASLEAGKRGLWALQKTDLFNLLCIPPLAFGTDIGPVTRDTALKYCKDRRAFFILDPPDTWTSVDTAEAGVDALNLRDENVAVYFPRVRMIDPLRDNQLNTFAPSGVIAGIYARTDARRGVWKAPAGTDASMSGVRELSIPLTDGENGRLNPIGVNCLRTFRGSGNIVWGARTLEGADELASEWKYIPVRRTALFIQETLYRALQWVVFEPNDEPLWAQIRLNVGSFMHTLFRQGAFQGSSPNEAYLVKCDSETTTQADIDRGVVNILVGFAPLKPAEFVFIRIQQLAGQLQT
jgi:uncharacterized protein